MSNDVPTEEAQPTEPTQPETVVEETTGQAGDNSVASSTSDDAVEGAAAEPAAAVPAAQPPAEEPKPTPVAKTPEPPAQEVSFTDMTPEQYVMSQNKRVKTLHRKTVEVISRMVDYCHAMDSSKVMNQNEGGVHQRNLYYTMLTALSAPDDAVKPSMDAISWFFMKYRKNCFAASHAMRFIGMMKVTSDQAQSFQFLMHCFMVLSDPKSRKEVLKQVDLGRASSKLETLEQRESFLAYFSQ